MNVLLAPALALMSALGAAAQPAAPPAPPVKPAAPAKLAVAPANDADAARLRSERLAQLAAWMTGSFATTEQAKRDATYYDVRLHSVQIWADPRDSSGAVWLYREQAMADRIAKPHRQRVYRLSAIDSTTFRCQVFDLPDDGALYVGAWADPVTKFKDLKPDSLAAREGCELTLRFEHKTDSEPFYAGSTREKECKTTLRGAAYTTSETRISRTQVVWWERGFDQAGRPVWGPEKGGYLFIRQVEGAAPTTPSESAPPAPANEKPGEKPRESKPAPSPAPQPAPAKP